MSSTGVPLREDLVHTHRQLLAHLAAPGSWWSGAERIAIAAESRGSAHEAPLPEPIVEMARRIRSEPQRLSRSWFERITAAGVEEGPYVEAVGVVAIVAGLDFFCRALGEQPFALPQPLAGEPSGYRPRNANPGPGWVSTLAPEDATGPEKDLYPEAPLIPNIRRALSLVPATARALRSVMQSHYVSIEDLTNPRVGRALDRMQMELVASRVSALNECFY